MATAQQVFDIAELLELIICQWPLSPLYWLVNETNTLLSIHELKAVKKTWNAMIRHSKAIRRARVTFCFDATEPFSKGSNADDTATEDLWSKIQKALTYPDHAIVKYRWSDFLRVNPCFNKVHVRVSTSAIGVPKSGFELTIRLPKDTDSIVDQRGDEFFSTPPCETVAVVWLCWDAGSDAWTVPEIAGTCWAYREDRLRVKDVLAVRDQVLQTQSYVAGDRDSDDEIVANVMISGLSKKPGSIQDMAKQSSYCEGPLPRYRRASHRLGPEGVAAYVKDQEMYWHPSMDI